MGKYRVDISEPAENDFLDIVRYITSQLSAPISATSMIEIFEEAIESLSHMSRCYLFIADERLTQMGYRKLSLKNYIILYSINEKDKVVNIERILYGRRNWLHIL